MFKLFKSKYITHKFVKKINKFKRKLLIKNRVKIWIKKINIINFL